MGLFFFFEDNRANLALFFAVSTLVLYLGPEWFLPGMAAAKLAPEVSAPAGRLRGVRTASRDGRDIFCYKGIPFAKAPVGSLRFLRPEPLDGPWEGVLDATSNGPACTQPFKFYPYWKGQEDCLYLNVYVPDVDRANKKSKKKLLPVMVWIHGGGFTMGDGSDTMAGPQYLLDRDVVLVSLQYRLGPWGAMDLRDGKATGNQAMWDQRAALRWVRDNVEAFGGDPARVTIMGESAGAVSVMSHLLSAPANDPAEENLFTAAIAMSGAPHGALVGLDRKRPMSDFHKMFADRMGCKDDLECLQGKSTEELSQGVFMFDECNFWEGVMANPSPWKPTADADSAANPFFADSPHLLVEEGRLAEGVPLLVGFTRDEGLLATAFLLGNPDKAELLRRQWDTCMTSNLLGSSKSDVAQEDVDLLRRLEEFYFPGKDQADVTLDNSFQNLTNIFTDCRYAYPVDVVVRSALEKKTSNKLFYYHFDHVGSFSVADVFSKSLPGLAALLLGKLLGYHTTSKLGVSHADDVPYIFGSSSPLRWHSDPADEVMSRTMVDLWVNFATHHHPTPKDKGGKVLGESLRELQGTWSASRLSAEEGRASYAVLRDAGIHFGETADVDRRLDFLRKIRET